MSNVSFVPFSLDDFLRYKAKSIDEYARDLIVSGKSTEPSAVKDASDELNEILPNGFETPNQFFNHILNTQGDNVGFIWFGCGENDVFIFDFAIHQNQREKGYGRNALHELERIAQEKGITEISLHVFDYNTVAFALYASMGYQVNSRETGSCYMQKNI